MNRTAHSLIGMGCGLATAHVLGINPLYGATLSVVGAGIPDIDLRWAPRHYTPRPGSCCKLNEHRGPTHAPVVAILAGMALGAVTAPWIGLMLAVGWFSHCFADSASYMGIPWLWPLSARRIRLLPYGFRVRSGTTVVELPIAFGVLALGLYLGGLPYL
jgi:membrane-bound metal-dependent hydrolase YbcI (DUF457 family)